MVEHADLVKEFDYYLAHQDEMVEQYDGKVIVLKSHAVIGVYDTSLEAFTETVREHERGTFIIQKVSAGDEAYSTTIHTPGVLPG